MFLLEYSPFATFNQAFAFLSVTLNAEQIKPSQSSQGIGEWKGIGKTWSHKSCLSGTRSSYREKPHETKIATPNDTEI